MGDYRESSRGEGQSRIVWHKRVSQPPSYPSQPSSTPLPSLSSAHYAKGKGSGVPSSGDERRRRLISSAQRSSLSLSSYLPPLTSQLSLLRPTNPLDQSQSPARSSESHPSNACSSSLAPQCSYGFFTETRRALTPFDSTWKYS
ncbi:unnamed protein product [Arctogadus glacialis]